MIKTIIVEDEERSRIVLKELLEKYCPNVSVIEEAEGVQEAIKKIHEHKPDLIFLDIQLKDGTGFDILENINESHADIIFTTAFDNYALKAFKYSAIDYLLKPIIIKELVGAVQKLKETEARILARHKIEHLLSNLKRKDNDPPLLLISTMNDIQFVKIDNIIRCEADGAYCTIYQKDGSSIMVSKVVKEFEFLLKDYNFFRVHQSHLVNLQVIKKYIKGDNCLLLNDGSTIPISKGRKEKFFSVLKEMSL